MIVKRLGSLYFAIFLILFTLLFVIAGTFLESWSASHLFAAHLTYQNPIFKLLLWLYFINILFAALSRYPFKKKHIPFLLTHLGLLMLLAGVFVKNHYGVQGAMGMKEGSSSEHLFLSNTFALHLETPEKQILTELKRGQIGPLATPIEGLELSILEWIPHAQERYEGFIKGRWGHILGLPPFEKSLRTPEYHIHLLNDPSSEIEFPGEASLYLMKDEDQKEHLIAFNQEGERFEHTFKGESYFVFDKGYGGYAAFVELPTNFPPLELIAPLTCLSTPLPPPRKKEEQTPRIRVLASYGSQSEIVTLTFDQYGQKFKWPMLGGNFLIRFQAFRQAIPFHVRLHSATQINYPGTNQPYSYESRATIGNDEAALSMNHVFEKMGYRFYLANLVSSPYQANQVQIVVNYDPAKYWLTYPGAIILALGIILLYLRRRYV